MAIPKLRTGSRSTSALHTILWFDKIRALLSLSTPLTTRIADTIKEILPSKPNKAVVQVLSIPELLNIIISHLPAETILPLQRVCKKWHLVISSVDPEIQINLYLRPAPPYSNIFLPGRPVFNLMLARKSENWLKDHKELSELNLVPMSWQRGRRSTRARGVHLLPWYREIAIWKVENASWRNMLVVQPPCTKLAFAKRNYADGGYLHQPMPVTGVVDCGDGLRMGVLYDLVEAWLVEGKETWENEGGASEGVFKTVQSTRRDMELWDHDCKDSFFFHVFADEMIWSWLQKMKAAAEIEREKEEGWSATLGPLSRLMIAF